MNRDEFPTPLFQAIFWSAIAAGAVLGLVSNLADWSRDATTLAAIATIAALVLVYGLLDNRNARRR